MLRPSEVIEILRPTIEDVVSFVNNASEEEKIGRIVLLNNRVQKDDEEAMLEFAIMMAIILKGEEE